MKRILYILSVAALTLTGCHKMELEIPSPVTVDEDIKVPISFNLMLPSDGVSTRAMADEPEIDHICVAVFGGSGFFNEWIVASIDNVQEVNYDGTPATIYSIRINLTMTESRLRLHFIANGPVEAPLTGQPAKDSEDGMMARLTSQLAWDFNDGYWQKVVLPLGVHAQTWINYDNVPPTVEYYKVNDQYVPTEETVAQFPNPIKLIRNFARIKVKLATDTDGNNISDLTSISYMALAYAPMEGTFAPMMAEAVNTDEYGHLGATDPVYLDFFVPDYSDLTMDELKAAPYNYKGYFPASIQLGGFGNDKSRKYPERDSEMTPWAADKYLYAYERTIPTATRPATRLVIKATHKVDGPNQYYRIDLHDGGASYALLRNFTYVVTIGSVASGTGKSTPKEAAESPSTSDVSAEITDLPEVSDGIAQIAVSFIEKTYVEGNKVDSLDFQFIPLISNDNTIDNTMVSIELGTGVGNEFVKDGTSGNGPAISGTPTISNTDKDWGRIKFTLTDNTANKYQTIRVIGTKNDGTTVYRDVVIYLKMKQLMTVECLDKYILEAEGQQERVRVYIPGDLSKSMFPLDFKVEPDSYALNPDGQNMPVNSGKSLSGNNQSVFYFIRNVTWEEYQALPQLENDSRKYFECNFKSTKAASAGNVWVSNRYFLNGADETATNPGSGNKDEFFNYTKRYFTNLMFSARVAEDEDVDFSFTMDAAHSGEERVLPGIVTVKLTGLIPKTGYTGLTLKDGEDDIYLFDPGSNPNATLQLTAIDEDYSVTLSTEDDDNPLLYDEASRQKSDPVPSVTNITVTPASASVNVGNTTSLTANLTGYLVDGFPIVWTSSDESIATVSATGVVTGVSEGGPVTITATAGGKSATATVRVLSKVWKTGNNQAYAMTFTSNSDGDATSFNDNTSGIRVVFSNFERGGNGNGSRYKQMGTRTGWYNNYTYNNGQFVVSIPNSSLEGIKITRITMTYTSTDYDNRTVTVTGDVSTTAQSSAGMTSWTSSSTGDGNGDNTVTVTMACSNSTEYNGRNRLTGVTVYYGYWDYE